MRPQDLHFNGSIPSPAWRAMSRPELPSRKHSGHGTGSCWLSDAQCREYLSISVVDSPLRTSTSLMRSCKSKSPMTFPSDFAVAPESSHNPRHAKTNNVCGDGGHEPSNNYLSPVARDSLVHQSIVGGLKLNHLVWIFFL
jgi:hypothetical protein